MYVRKRDRQRKACPIQSLLFGNGLDQNFGFWKARPQYLEIGTTKLKMLKFGKA